jgi:hypothetical protein
MTWDGTLLTERQGPYPPFRFPPPGMNPDWWPINAGQQSALDSDADLLLMGGQSGGGKSGFLVGDAMQEYRNPALRGLIIRESLTEMQELNDWMEKVYTPLGARWRGRLSSKAWVFPLGGSIRPGYLAKDKDLKRYRGNPYSWLGVDESGLHPEHRIRQMVGWLAAPRDSDLRVRGRFTSNPGGIGHGWQMAVFLRGKCPVHYPATSEDNRPQETSVYPGYVYAGSRWPSDGGLVHKTVAFYPSKLSENPFYDEDKRASLLSQTAAIRAQLLDGCWCNAEGLYFDFLRPSAPYVIPYATINDEWWWNHFLSIDYGFGNSSAAAGQYSVPEHGSIFKTRERVEKKMGSVNFAKAICTEGFPAGENNPAQAAWDPERPRFSFVVIDSANDQHTGTGKSNFELMAEVFAEWGIPCIKAAKDPMGNAQNLYNGLSNQAIVLTDLAPKTFTSLSSRTIDDRKAVKKIHGDPLDDVYDETSYGFNTWISEGVKPARTKLQEELDQMRKAGTDETSVARYAWQQEQAIRQQEVDHTRGVSLVGPRIGNLQIKR